MLCANNRIEALFGSVGRFMPGMEWKLEPVDGVSEVAPDGRIISGRLFVRGPNVMRGYLNSEADTAFQALGGWYDTGDLARIDDDGFVFLLGRMKRFAKISGEMVSLTAVEDALAGAFPSTVCAARSPWWPSPTRRKAKNSSPFAMSHVCRWMTCDRPSRPRV